MSVTTSAAVRRASISCLHAFAFGTYQFAYKTSLNLRTLAQTATGRILCAPCKRAFGCCERLAAVAFFFARVARVCSFLTCGDEHELTYTNTSTSSITTTTRAPARCCWLSGFYHFAAPESVQLWCSRHHRRLSGALLLWHITWRCCLTVFKHSIMAQAARSTAGNNLIVEF